MPADNGDPGDRGFRPIGSLTKRIADSVRVTGVTPNGSDSAEGSFAADWHAAWRSWVLRATEFARSNWNREMLEQMRRVDRKAWSTIEHLGGPLSWRNGNGQPPRRTVVQAN